MVGASKILTVSYGTFSCTLEGFDDPFNTMRSIAEYFRDLAAEDRFFGAEPPTPDVSHLHALAQHDNPRAVAAHIQDNGLRLTQADVETVVDEDVQEPASAVSSAAAPLVVAAAATVAAAAPVVAAAVNAVAAPRATPMDEDEDDELAFLLDGIDDDKPLELDDEDDGNLFDVEATEPAPAPKPAYDPRAAIAAKLAAARIAVDSQERRPRTPQVSDEDIAAAAAQSPTRALKRPDAFRDDLDSLNEGKSDLSDEDEAALLAELASLQDDGDAPKGKDGKALLESDLIEREEAALDRLLAKTNSKLTDGDVQQKRASLSHLKAAVAATMADRNANEDHGAEEADPDSAYRADLAKAVHPKPAAQPTPKPAPLVLVADRDAKPAANLQARSNAPVRPRRVDTAQQPRSRKESDEGFAAYTDKMGAADLGEMMEAAAAYLNLVEGADSFTRPQVMHMVLRQERGKNFTREDSLRSFDSLVRKGSIQKVDHGQFAIHEDSRYAS